MQLIPLDAVVVPPNRQRGEFDEDALYDLARSIGEVGLLHPIVVERGGGKITLVAGERRLRAIKRCAFLQRPVYFENRQLIDEIPCVFLDEMQPMERYQVELEENMVRADLTWQERAQALARLAELRGNGPGTAAAIAQDVHGRSDGMYSDNVRKAIIVAQHLDDKDVARATNINDAFKLLKSKEQLTQARATAASKPEGASWCTILQMDALEFCKTYTGPKFDVLCTDPPYGMGADDFGDSGGKMNVGHAYDDDPKRVRDMLGSWVFLVSEVLAPNCHVYQFCDFDNFHEIKQWWEEAGFNVFRTPIIWFKPSGYRAPWPNQGPQRKYECILYAVRGEKPVRRVAGDVIPLQNDNDTPHAARKPIGLFQDLLSRSCLPGERVLDTFAGSGPIIPAARALQLEVAVVDMDEASVGLCHHRLEGLA